MEGLVLLLAEFLALPMLAAATITLDLLVLSIELFLRLAELTLAGILGRRKPSVPAPPNTFLDTKWRWSRWRNGARWLGAGAAGVLVLLLLSLTVVNWWLLDDLVRWQLVRAERETGVAVAFGSMHGSVWTGEAVLLEVTAKRAGSPLSNFDLSARRVRINLAVWEMLFLRAKLEQFEIHEVLGTYERIGMSERLQPRRPFRIGRLEVTNASVQIRDHTRPKPVQAQVEVHSLRVEPLRSDWAIFDVLFRGNAAGRINGHAFSVATRELADGRQTQWHAQGLPVELLAPYIGGPLLWIESGALDLEVTDRWKIGQQTEIDLHWQFTLRDVRAEVPANASRTTTVFATPAVAFLNRHPNRLALEFEVAVDRERFHFAASPEAAGLTNAVGQALAEEIGRLAGIEPEDIRRAAMAGWTQFKDFLDKRRKPDRP
ncbi:MAG: DUF748 domain-containing protein [Pirellulaceae bacterium]|nr:DUF748 domain-containing protein [Pirellulaceae bacterium]